MRRFLKKIGVAAVVLLLVCTAAVAALFIAPPRVITRQLAMATSSWMMDGEVTGRRFPGLFQRLSAGYVQTAIAADVAARLSDSPGDDVRNLARIMTFVRGHMLTAHQFEHAAIPHASLVRGVGFCDQVNAAVAVIAAAHFERSELYALVDPATGYSPHTLGRIWSAERNDWLYFDAFYADAHVFTKDAAGRPHYLETDIERVPARGIASREVYSLSGMTLSEYERTYGAFLVTRLRRGSVAAPSPEPVMLEEVAVIEEPPPQLIDDEAFRTISRAFVAARVDDLFGQRPIDAYRRIAADPLANRDQRAQVMAALAGTIADAENVTR